MTKQPSKIIVEKQVCINFFVKLDIPPWKHLNDSEGCSYGKLMIGNFITTTAHASHLMQSFLVKHQITQVTQSLYSPDLVPSNFWLFPKLKSPWKGRDFRLLMRFRKIKQDSWWQLGELCEVPRCLLGRGLRHHCPMYSIPCIFFKKCLFFILRSWIPSGQNTYTCIHTK